MLLDLKNLPPVIATGEAKQSITLGINSGYEYIGLSAVSEKKELYAAEILLRKDLVKLNSGGNW